MDVVSSHVYLSCYPTIALCCYIVCKQCDRQELSEFAIGELFNYVNELERENEHNLKLLEPGKPGNDLIIIYGHNKFKIKVVDLIEIIKNTEWKIIPTGAYNTGIFYLYSIEKTLKR